MFYDAIKEFYCFSFALHFFIALHFMLYYLQAFPAGSGPTDRTTYMFTYVDAKPGSPTLEELLEEYWDLLPQYQVRFHCSISLLTQKLALVPLSAAFRNLVWWF